jgi:hypothetical protein
MWLTSGTAGLERGLVIGALLVLGLGTKNILDTFWKRGAEEPSAAQAQPEPMRATPRAFDRTSGHPALRGFERRFSNPRA